MLKPAKISNSSNSEECARPRTPEGPDGAHGHSTVSALEGRGEIDYEDEE
jgi:hypothetical protein